VPARSSWNRPRDAGGDAKSLKNQHGSPLPHPTQEHQAKAMDKMEQGTQKSGALATISATVGSAAFPYFFIGY
jgi:hypothetical protein